VNFINNRFVQRRLDGGDLLCHAAAVVSQDRGLAIAAAAGSGKSTLALKLLNHGLDFVSNDRLLIRRVGEAPVMTGLPKHPRINPGTILNNPRLERLVSPADRDRYLSMPPDQLWSLEEKYDGDIGRCYGPGRVRLTAPLRALVMLSWRRDGGALRTERVDLRSRKDLLQALIKNPGVHYHHPGKPKRPVVTDDEYLECLAGCPVFELSGGADFDAAASACLEMLEEAAHCQDSRC
jgi:HprK-related kinase B